ncbi:MAG: type II toxin-antitoxin system PemK/MazF family toxin [Dysgonamonadaceae bacterium]|jgi:mRNA interferase MazF|nr:type II toxin-antitoxin system PemK/MazF family toxin [Dysgonamonadaceae bacterium]
MTFEQYEIWLADLNPQIGTEPGKIRPVLVVQTDMLNKIPHMSVLICPITTNVVQNVKYLRVHVTAGMASLHNDCDIMIDQIRAIDSKRMIKRLGRLHPNLAKSVKEKLSIILSLND